jgi:hypothetical protein
MWSQNHYTLLDIHVARPCLILRLSNTHVCDSTAWSQRDCFNTLWWNVETGSRAEKSHPIRIRNLNLALKGTVSRDEYFCWRSKHFIQYFMCLRWWFSRSFKSFSLPYIHVIVNFSGLLEGFSKLVSNFKRSNLTLWVCFFHSSKKQKNVKTIGACTESTVHIYRYKPSKKLFISWHNPFKGIYYLGIQACFNL